MHVGRLIHILSHTMKRHNPAEVMENDDLTTMQKHVLKFILLETMHRDLYQKDIEEEFQIRKPTVTGILKLMEKNGYIYRESAKQDARLKQIIPTEKAEKIRPAILKSIEEGEAKMLRGIPKEDVELCKQVLSDNPLFFILNSYTTGLSPAVMEYLLGVLLQKDFGGKVSSDEIGLKVSDTGLVLPCGSTAIWEK